MIRTKLAGLVKNCRRASANPGGFPDALFLLEWRFYEII